MSRVFPRLAAVIMFVCGACAVWAAEPKCSPSMAKRAEERASAVGDWDEMYSAYKTFAECDDGGVGEAFSDSVGRLLSSNRGGLKRLFALTTKDTGFERFVIRHIDETIPIDVLAAIERNARERCPREAERLCRAVLEAAKH